MFPLPPRKRPRYDRHMQTFAYALLVCTFFGALCWLVIAALLRAVMFDVNMP